jgi:hypothetical protein
MKISRKSWHYRFLKWMRCSPIPDNLCGYFWVVVLAGLAIAAISTVAVVLSPIWVPAWVYCKLQDRFDEKFPPKEKPAREPGLLRQWLKAKKDRVCPLLEWTE